MIVDKILDRKDGVPYDAHDFYTYCMEEYAISQYYIGAEITRAMDFGENQDVQDALCKYILEQDYNPDICDYIRSVNWIKPDPLNPMCTDCLQRKRKRCHGTTEMVWTGCVHREV